jgi:hypothetical protein
MPFSKVDENGLLESRGNASISKQELWKGEYWLALEQLDQLWLRSSSFHNDVLWWVPAGIGRGRTTKLRAMREVLSGEASRRLSVANHLLNGPVLEELDNMHPLLPGRV